MTSDTGRENYGKWTAFRQFIDSHSKREINSQNFSAGRECDNNLMIIANWNGSIELTDSVNTENPECYCQLCHLFVSSTITHELVYCEWRSSWWSCPLHSCPLQGEWTICGSLSCPPQYFIDEKCFAWMRLNGGRRTTWHMGHEFMTMSEQLRDWIGIRLVSVRPSALDSVRVLHN